MLCCTKLTICCLNTPCFLLNPASLCTLFCFLCSNINLMNPYLRFKTQLKWLPHEAFPNTLKDYYYCCFFPFIAHCTFPLVITKITLQCRKGGKSTTHSPAGLNSWQVKLILHVCPSPYPQGMRKNTLKSLRPLGLPSSSFKSFSEEVSYASLSCHISRASSSLVSLNWSET